MMQRNNGKVRYTALDILRSLAIIAMVTYHTLWDLVYMFGADIPWFETKIGFIFQQSICWTFILLSGFCFSLGGHKLRRSLIVLGCSVVITVVTAIFMPESIIIHGVLSLLGSAMLLSVPLEKVFDKIPPALGCLVCFLIFAVTRNVADGIIGIGELSTEMPTVLYANSVTAFFGFPGDGFFSSDYFPLIPWVFLFWTGLFLFKLFKKKNLLYVFTKISCKPLEFIGRHSLEIYMAHQPIIYLVLSIIF